MLMLTGWVGKAIVAAVMMVPFILVIGAFGRVFKTPPEALIFWWLFGTAIGIAIYLGCIGQARSLFLDTQLSTVAILGLTIGACANILLVQSMITSPNPGIPVAILGVNAAIAFVLGPSLAFVLPKYFEHFKFDLYHFVAILLILSGIGILSIHK